MKSLTKLMDFTMILAIYTPFTQAAVGEDHKSKDRCADVAAIHATGATILVTSKAPNEPLEKRVQTAEKIFVGIVTNIKILDDDWCHADLKVTRVIAGVKVNELVPVQWRPSAASYDAKENQEGLALLKYKDGNRYWLRSDTFVDPKFADEAAAFHAKNAQ